MAHKKNGVYQLILVLTLCPRLVLAAGFDKLVLEAKPLGALTRIVSEKTKKPAHLKGIEVQLFDLKKEQLWGNPLRCALKADALMAKVPTVRKYVAQSFLSCALRIPDSDSKKPAQVRKALGALVKFETRAERGGLREQLARKKAEGLLFLAAHYLKKDRGQVLRQLDQVFELRDLVETSHRAQMYRLLGELAFVQQSLSGAEYFFRQSLNEQDSSDLQSRILVLQKQLKAPTSSKDLAKTSAKTEGIDQSEEETEISKRMAAALGSGEIYSAIDDGVKLIDSFPGSARAKWASERILESFLAISEKSDEKLEVLRSQAARLMAKARGQYSFEWAKSIYARGLYKPAFVIFNSACSKLEQVRLLTDCLLYLGRSALYIGDDTVAQSSFKELVQYHGGTNESAEAYFRLGMIFLRRKDPSSAIAYFQRLLVLPRAEKWELSGRYFLVRAFEGKQPQRAAEERDLLIAKFPFSYYGLKLRTEAAGGELNWSESAEAKKIPIKQNLFLMPAQKLSLGRFETLARSGWLDEAEEELRSLPPPTGPEEKALLASYWARILKYARAVSMVNEAWDENPALRRSPFLQIAYPREFEDLISAQAQKYRINPYVLFSLIKQESMYQPRAMSKSRAYGLMQLIRPTAEEVNAKLKLKKITSEEDIYEIERNLALGTRYLSDLIDRYKGYLPLALAAYNAGPTRLERWLNSRKATAAILTGAASGGAPNAGAETTGLEGEIWVDELPWSETSFYVKAILRNILLYRLFSEGPFKLEPQFWQAL